MCLIPVNVPLPKSKVCKLRLAHLVRLKYNEQIQIRRAIAMNKSYVLVLCLMHKNSEMYETKVLLIQKDRPDWQKGKLNLPGGKIEAGETPKQTAVREIKEETGLDASLVKQMGIIKDADRIIYCMEALVNYYEDLSPREGETEIPFWMSLEEALNDKRLIPNLKLVIPLMALGVAGWVITDDISSGESTNHAFSINV